LLALAGISQLQLNFDVISVKENAGKQVFIRLYLKDAYLHSQQIRRLEHTALSGYNVLIDNKNDVEYEKDI
jgi:hypothetical protein